jgi:hypothetical protein
MELLNYLFYGFVINYGQQVVNRNHKKVSRSLRQLNVKKRHRFKKATLYEREVIKKQKLFIRSQKLPYSYNM